MFKTPALMADEACQRWEKFLYRHAHGQLRISLDQATPTTLAVKYASAGTLRIASSDYFNLGDQEHSIWTNDGENGRVISVIRKRDLFGRYGLRYLELIQRRPGMRDLTGSDHLSLRLPSNISLQDLKTELERENDIVCSFESPEKFCRLSVVVNGYEFKLSHHVVWDICQDEMKVKESWC